MSGAARTVTGFREKLLGTNEQADYAQQAAMADLGARRAVTAEARATRDRLNLAAQSPQQLSALERSLDVARKQVDTDIRQLDAIDPAIMEASSQVLKLLRGEQAGVNKPIMEQRAAQRQNLLNSLRSQYGPGAEASSIGQRALQQFDMETNALFQQNQMSTLGNAFNIATTRVAGPGFGQLMQAAGGFGDYQSRLAQAEQAGSQGILQGMTGEVQSAAAPFTKDLIRTSSMRQHNEQMRDDGRQIGRSWATMGMGSKGGGGSPSSSPGGSTTNSGAVGNYQLSNPGTTNANFWSRNPYE